MLRKLTVTVFIALILVATLASGALAAQPANATGVMVSELASGRVHPHSIPTDYGFSTMGYSIGRPSIL
jgi:hypothetical protein